MYDEYINASKAKVPAKGKGKQGDGKGLKSKWRPACDDYWKPGGCSQGYNCPKYHPRRQPGRCAICGSTKHATSQCSRPVKPRAKNAEWDESTWYCEEEKNVLTINGSRKSMRRPRVRKEKSSKALSRRASQRGRMPLDRLLLDLQSLRRRRMNDPNPDPNLKPAHA